MPTTALLLNGIKLQPQKILLVFALRLMVSEDRNKKSCEAPTPPGGPPRRAKWRVLKGDGLLTPSQLSQRVTR